jgi:hypothetical protein
MISLSEDEIKFFAQEGYVIKRGVLDEDLMKRGRDRMWANLPPPLECDRPDTWVGPLEQCDDPDSHRHNYMWRLRAPGREGWMIRLLATDPSVWGMAEQLLGEDSLVTPDRIRGIYCVVRDGDIPERPTTCHVDAHPFHLGVVGYIDDVGPASGGFTVWPKSHRRFYYDFKSQYKHEPNDQYQADKDHFDQQPYRDCHGKAGDIVFWHHRIGHSVGHNRSDRIRQAVLYDYKKRDLKEDEPPCDYMWRDWPGVIRALEG